MYPTRPVPLARRGMVSCPHHLASSAGLRILQQGGNAIDAAIAINSTLGVVYPHMTGMGGDAFWLIYEAKTGKIHALNGSGRSALRATRDVYRSQGLETIPVKGALAAITVPGTVDAWVEAQQRFGRLTLAEVLQPAIEYAEAGYPVSDSQRRWTQANLETLKQYVFSAQIFLDQGDVPTVGSFLANPDLAETMRSLARNGRDAFYRGAIAEEICRYLAEVGGLLTLEDFSAHQSDWVEAIATQYRGKTIYEFPPNTQGFTVLQMLNLLEAFDLQKIGHGTADYIHLIVEATKLAFADRDRWLTDPAFVEIPVQQLISKDYAASRRSLINLQQAQPYQAGNLGGDTTYSAVVDAEGNAVSMIQSLYYDFGSGVVAGKTGVLLQNRGCFFSLDPQQANCLEPGKRSFHTLIPALGLDEQNRLFLVFGTMGGEGQPQTQIMLLTRLLDFGFDPQTAIDLPRWIYGRTWGDTSTALTLENRISSEVCETLSQRGHPIRRAPAWAEQMGHAHIIQIDPDTGLLSGGSDPRSDGAAIAW